MAFRIDRNAAASMPTPAAVDTPGYFHDGDPATGKQATPITADILNMFQEEIVTVVEEAGLTLDKTDPTQLYQALQVLFGSAGTWTSLDPAVRVLTTGSISTSWVDVDISSAVPADATAVLVLMAAATPSTPGTCNFSIQMRGKGYSGATAPAIWTIVTDQNTSSNPAQLTGQGSMGLIGGDRTLQVISGVSATFNVTIDVIAYLT